MLPSPAFLRFYESRNISMRISSCVQAIPMGIVVDVIHIWQDSVDALFVVYNHDISSRQMLDFFYFASPL